MAENAEQKPCESHRHLAGWRLALVHAAPVSLFILALFYHWFAIANRYAVFLYEHLGATPFDEVTSSRYWMSGLVACGLLSVLYVAANGLLGRGGHCPPAWWQVWALSALPLAAGIPVITMATGQPALPLALAARCTLVTLAALALALLPGALAATKPGDLAWLVLDGLGLVPTLVLGRAVELPGRGLAVSPHTAYLVAFGGAAAGLVWFAILSALHTWRHRPAPGATAIYLAGLSLSYLGLPLLHHAAFTPRDYRYISAAANLFAFNPVLQAAVLLMAALIAFGVTRLRRITCRSGAAGLKTP